MSAALVVFAFVLITLCSVVLGNSLRRRPLRLFPALGSLAVMATAILLLFCL